MDVDEFLAEADDVIDEWHGSVDAAQWAADGSHENDDRIEMAPPFSRVVVIEIDPVDLRRNFSLWDRQMRHVSDAVQAVGEVLRRTASALLHSLAVSKAKQQGMPLPVPPRHISHMTARQYRADRRRYARQMRSVRRGTWHGVAS